jgi:hypothetical protein
MIDAEAIILHLQKYFTLEDKNSLVYGVFSWTEVQKQSNNVKSLVVLVLVLVLVQSTEQ